MTITIHHLRISRSTRIIWLAEELGLDYELVCHDRDPETFRAPPSLKEVHPMSKAPAVVIDGNVIVESGAIIEFMTEKYGNGKLAHGAGDAARAEYLEWMHFSEGTLGMPMIMRMLGPRMGLPEGALAWMDAELAKQLDYAEQHLEGREYLCGNNFTGADINLSYMLEHAEGMGLLSTRPNLARYQRSLTSRDAYKKAIELGGPVTLAR